MDYCIHPAATWPPKLIFFAFQAMNEEYSKWFTHKPARSCVAVKTLPKNADVELEAIALP